MKKLLAGTDKGLLEFHLTLRGWRLNTIHFTGFPVSFVEEDVRNGIWRVTINHKHWGPKIHHSSDRGKNWETLISPGFPENDLDEKLPAVKRCWTIAHGKADDPDTFYVGVEPAALFKTEDNGKTFQFVRSLWSHPSRNAWTGGGKGSMDPFLHGILIDPEDVDHIYVGISCAGVFESLDGGDTWMPKNDGLVADFLPQTTPGVGHDPHSLKMSAQNPAIIWQQNHCGVFKTENGGELWYPLAEIHGKPNYGFALAVDNHDDESAWVVPAQNDDLRIPFENRLAVFHTNDGGKSWHEQTRGLPQTGCFDLALRHAMDMQNGHLAFGTNNGNLYYSGDYGEEWQIVSQNLATVRCVRFVD